MRLTELSLEKYGCYSERMIGIPDGVGLTVVYGLNEAGKSTYLEAIGDFLFGIPKSSPRGDTFGYPSMKIGADMRLGNGEVMSLRRRKGNGKTLSDGKGATFDDSLLASTVLGAINRDRFETLFGLNHETLRSGGDDLLDANGDIGRLIVEAGGGLRAMVVRLEAVDKEADGLFAKTRSQSRKFYEALSRYETAKKAYRALQRHVDDNWKHGLIDLRKPGTKLPKGHDHSNALGYVGIANKALELWLPGPRFEEIAGGAREARLLKHELARHGRLSTWASGNQSPKSVVRRPIPGFENKWVVAIKLPKAYATRSSSV